MPTPPIPGWNDPVATGTRSPIFSVAFWLSSARTCGFCNIFVSLSPITADKLAAPIETWKSVAFRLPRVFNSRPPALEPVLVVPVVEVVEVVLVLILLCKVTVALLGGRNPKVRDLSLLTCKTAMSTTTSGRALSKSSTSFSARAI